MNLQGLFDKVAQHLLTQNAQALCDEGCAYRGKDGTKCAVGCLIKDEFYAPMLENTIFINTAAVREAVIKSLEGEADSSILTDYGTFKPEASQLLQQLQTVHDQFTVAEWPDELKDTADMFNLEWNHEPAEPVR